MMTAIAIFEAAGMFIVGGIARAALLIAAIVVLSLPIVLFASAVHAAETGWHRLHPSHHHA